MNTAVLVVSYRTPALTERAVRSALASTEVSEVVIVDNASGDDTVARLRAIVDTRVIVIANDRNAGFGAAANLAASHATADVLIFLNSDAKLRPGSVERLADAVRQADGLAIAGPRLIGDDGGIQRSAGLVPKPGDLLVRGLGLHRLATRLQSFGPIRTMIGRSSMASEYDLALTATGTIEVSMVSGACLAVGRAAFLAIGGFDEHYFMYFEDADLCRRAARRPWPILYVPRAVVDHVGGASSDDDYHFGPRHSASMVRYLRTWHGLFGALTGVAILTVRWFGETITGRPTRARARSSLRAGLGVLVRR